MRTTLILDDDIAERLQAEARRSGRPFKTVVNEPLRIALSRRREVRRAQPFRTEVVNLGGPVEGANYDNIADLLARVEGSTHG